MSEDAESPSKPSTSEGRTKGGNFTPAEDVVIARAYVSVTEDPITGSEQKGNTFYERVHAEYLLTNTDHIIYSRKSSSIQNRLKLMGKAVRRFSNAYNAVTDFRPSGTNDDEVMRIATGFYNGCAMKLPTDDPGKPFHFKQAWEILRRLPKFQADEAKESGDGNKKESATDGTSKGSSTDGTSSGRAKDEVEEKSGGFYKAAARERPKGWKHALSERDRYLKSEKKLRMASTSLKIHDEQVKQMANQNAMIAFSQGPGGSDSAEEQEFFNLMREEALIAARERKRKREEKDQNYQEGERSGLEVLSDTVGDVVDL